ncbi:PaaD-like zinc ribbon domain-containing protein [Natronobiforma cellulositropha]|nr:hypothetical protein [Natronobiforma cellulositropha]
MRSVTCPFCETDDVRLEQQVGSALCRTLYYCQGCGEPFEEFG